MYLYEKKLTKFMYDYCFGENIDRDNFEEEVMEVSIDEYNNGKLPFFAYKPCTYEPGESDTIIEKYKSGFPKVVRQGYYEYTLSQTGLVLIEDYFDNNTYDSGATIYLYDSKTKKLMKTCTYCDGELYTEITLEYKKNSIKITKREFEEFDYEYTRE